MERSRLVRTWFHGQHPELPPRLHVISSRLIAYLSVLRNITVARAEWLAGAVYFIWEKLINSLVGLRTVHDEDACPPRVSAVWLDHPLLYNNLPTVR